MFELSALLRAAMIASPNNPNGRIVGLFPELLGIGGIQEASRLTAAALVEIASRYGFATKFLSLNDPPGFQAFPSHIGEISFRGFGRAKVQFAFAALELARKPTRIVLAGHPYLAAAAVQMRLFNRKLRTVLVSHGVEVWQRLPWLRSHAFMRADLHMAPSSYTVQKIGEVQGVARVKTRRVAWPLSPVIAQMAERPQKLGLPAGFPKGLVILSVARLMANERYKGVDLLMQAVAQLAPGHPSLELVVVGRGDDLPRHVQLAAKLAIVDRVRFFDNISPAETAACYSCCDIFALPSTGEGFGFVFLEAMAFRKPVIGAAAGGVTDIIEDRENGWLVPPGDLDSLVEAIDRLLGNESVRSELGRKGAERVRSRYSFAAFRSELEAVLRDCGVA
jgi:phosphatidylinositol alpha-1,6-mannosyltransferase